MIAHEKEDRMYLTRLLAAVAVVLACAASGARAAAAVPICSNGSLHVSARSRHNSTAGSTYVGLVFTNRSGHTCALTGYPGVSAVDAAGRRLGAPATRNPQTSVRTVVVAPGRRATALVQITDAGVFPQSSCRAVRAVGLRVYAPNTRVSQVARYSFRACSVPGHAYLHVGAVAPA
jgi:Protein of unknown function (DUF4232)